MKSTNIHVTHKLSDGTIIKSVREIVVPDNHPVYAFLANIIKKRLQSEQTEKGA